jgi:hypothetical protein
MLRQLLVETRQALIEAPLDDRIPQVGPERSRGRVVLPEALQLVKRQLQLVVRHPPTASIKSSCLVGFHQTSWEQGRGPIQVCLRTTPDLSKSTIGHGWLTLTSAAARSAVRCTLLSCTDR